MAGYGWRSRHGNMLEPTHIACRICDRVFMNAQALIDHIESHMAEDPVGAAAPRTLFNLLPYQPLRGPLPNPFELSLSPPQTAPVRRPYSFKSFQNPNRFHLGFNPTAGVTKRNVSRTPFYLMGKKFTPRGPHGPYILEAQNNGVAEARGVDCTRPFLHLLDKPGSVASTESKKTGEDDGGGSAELDLSLKL